ncbi:Protein MITOFERRINLIKE 1, chloroplastic [Glycine soja]
MEGERNYTDLSKELQKILKHLLSSPPSTCDSSSFGLPSPKLYQFSISNLTDFPSLLTHFSSHTPTLPFASTSKWAWPNPKPLLKTLFVLDRALIDAVAGGLVGAFTYVCLLPLDTIKTKMQTKGVAQIYKNTLGTIVKTFQSEGILGFYSGVFVVVVGSTTLPCITRSSKRTRIATPRLGKLQVRVACQRERCYVEGEGTCVFGYVECWGTCSSYTLFEYSSIQQSRIFEYSQETIMLQCVKGFKGIAKFSVRLARAFVLKAPLDSLVGLLRVKHDLAAKRGLVLCIKQGFIFINIHTRLQRQVNYQILVEFGKFATCRVLFLVPRPYLQLTHVEVNLLQEFCRFNHTLKIHKRNFHEGSPRLHGKNK